MIVVSSSVFDSQLRYICIYINYNNNNNNYFVNKIKQKNITFVNSVPLTYEMMAMPLPHTRPGLHHVAMWRDVIQQG